MTFEHRSIDNFAVVNAITLDSSGNPVSVLANVASTAAPLGRYRAHRLATRPEEHIHHQLRSNVNHLQNVGVGGTTLAEAGYDSARYDHNLHVTNVTTVSPKLMHEARLSIEWDGETDTPVSTAPQLQVAGAFTGGGSTVGPQQCTRSTSSTTTMPSSTPKTI